MNEIKVGDNVQWQFIRFSGGRRRTVTCTGTVTGYSIGNWVIVLPDGKPTTLAVERAQLTVTTGAIERVASDYVSALRVGDFSGREG